MRTTMVDEEGAPLGLHAYGDEMICFYLSEALDVPIEVFEKMLRNGDIVAVDMCMWCAAAIRDPSVFEDDAVAEKVRARVRALTGWRG